MDDGGQRRSGDSLAANGAIGASALPDFTAHASAATEVSLYRSLFAAIADLDLDVQHPTDGSNNERGSDPLSYMRDVAAADRPRLLTTAELDRLSAAVKETAQALVRSLEPRVLLGREPGVWKLLSSLLVHSRNQLLSTLGSPDKRGVSSPDVAASGLILSTALFQLVRNLCAAVSDNQIRAKNADLPGTGEEILSYLCSWLVTTERPYSTTREKVTACVHMGTQMLANIMTGNPEVQNILWPHYFIESDLLKQLLKTNDRKTTKYVLLATYNCIYNDAHRSSYLLNTTVGRHLITCFLRIAAENADSEDDLFEIICGIFCNLVEVGLTSETFKAISMTQSRCTTGGAWLSKEHVTFLKFIDGLLDSKLRPSTRPTLNNSAIGPEPSFTSQSAVCVLSDSSCLLFVSMFIRLVSVIDSFAECHLPTFPSSGSSSQSTSEQASNGPGKASESPLPVNDLDAVILLLQYLSRALRSDDPVVAVSCGSGLHQRRLESLKLGLGAALVQLLRLADRLQPPTKTGPLGRSNRTDPASGGTMSSVSYGKSPASPETMVAHGLFMLKVDVVKVIANLCYRCMEAQDELRERGALQAVLNNCNIDDTNPFIKEWSIFAIRNLCENNPTNQALVAGLQPQAVAPDLGGVLEAAGVQASLTQEGRVRISQTTQ
ncbi:spinocerebellar ataxia type 10 protein domain-containing protein [Zopfochytrium polystomum]|nr:spinocerebellar ataxia type 10 protein domain-containing protein [Zopfochytrium polystomum]